MNRYSLRLIIPAVLLFFLLLLSVWVHKIYEGYVIQKIEDDTRQELIHKMPDIQSGLEYNARIKDRERMKEKMANFNSDYTIELALLISPEGKIIASNNFLLLEEPWQNAFSSDEIPDFTEQFQNAKDIYSGRVEFYHDKEKIICIYPVQFAITWNMDNTSEMGIVFIRKNIKDIKQSIQKDFYKYMLRLWSGFIIFILLLGLFLDLFVIDRIKSMVIMTQKISQGNMEVRTLAEGSDEIAELGKSLNNMAEKRFLAEKKLKEEINERKEAEEALRKSQDIYQNLVETCQDLIWQCDNEGRYTYLNPAWEEVSGYKINEIIGKKFTDFQDREQAEQDINEFNFLMKGNMIKGYETIYNSKSGSKIHLLFNAKYTKDREGNITGAQGTAYDITRRKKAEEERIEIERRLFQSQKLESLGIMAGGIAHDFNNLLSIILGNLDLAITELPELSPVIYNIDNAKKTVLRASDLVKQILAYSGKSQFILKHININELIEENYNLFRAAIPQTINLELHLTEDLPLINSNKGQLQQVMMNLLTNASEAIGDSSGIINISTGSEICNEIYLKGSRIEEKPQAGNFVYLKVTDTGCGMDEHTKQSIFDPFFTTRFLGRGLGMSAVLGIVRSNRGAIFLDSKPGNGTEIKLLFPTSEKIKELQVENTENKSILHSQSDTILIVDDEEMLRKVCRAMVERLGFKVITASNGNEAVEIFKNHFSEIHCIILDLTMPGMNGIETFIELKKIEPSIKVILSSGYSTDEIKEKSAGYNFFSFLEKPYEFKKLQNELIK